MTFITRHTHRPQIALLLLIHYSCINTFPNQPHGYDSSIGLTFPLWSVYLLQGVMVWSFILALTSATCCTTFILRTSKLLYVGVAFLLLCFFRLVTKVVCPVRALNGK